MLNDTNSPGACEYAYKPFHAPAVTLTWTIFDCYYRLDLATLPWIAARATIPIIFRFLRGLM